MNDKLCETSVSGWRNALTWSLLGLILCAAATVRFYKLDAYGLWIDEAYTYLSLTGEGLHGLFSTPENCVIAHPSALANPNHAGVWWKVCRPDFQDIHPPLYVCLLRLWVSVFGWEPTGARAFSIFLSLLSIVLMYGAVNELSGWISGLFTAAIMAFSQAQIDFSREARSYMLVITLAAAAAWAILRIERLGANYPRLICLGLACLALLFTQYLACAVVVTLLVYGLARLRGKARRGVVLVCVGALLLFLLAWGPVIYTQSHGVSKAATSGYLADPATDHLPMTLARLIILPSRYLFDPLPDMEFLLRAMPIIVLVAVMRLRRRPDLLLWIIWLLVNSLPALVVDLTQNTMSLQMRRYTIQASLGFYAMLAVLCNGMRPVFLRYSLPSVAVIGCCLHCGQVYTAPSRTKQGWREFAAEYSHLAKPGDLTIFLATPPRRDDYTDYLCIGYYVPQWPGPVLLLNRPPDRQLLWQIRSYHYLTIFGDGVNQLLQHDLPGARIVDLQQRVFLGQVCRIKVPQFIPDSEPH